MSAKHHVNHLSELSKLSVRDSNYTNEKLECSNRIFSLRNWQSFKIGSDDFILAGNSLRPGKIEAEGRLLKLLQKRSTRIIRKQHYINGTARNFSKRLIRFQLGSEKFQVKKNDLFCRNLPSYVSGLTSLHSSSPQTILFRLEIRGDRRQAASDFGQFAARAGQWLLFIPFPRSFSSLFETFVNSNKVRHLIRPSLQRSFSA